VSGEISDEAAEQVGARIISHALEDGGFPLADIDDAGEVTEDSWRDLGAAGDSPPADAGGAAAGAPAGLSWAEQSGILRSAAAGKGNFGLGSATAKEAIALGESWVGDDYRVLSDGITMISADEMRQFRLPTYKPYQDIYQANFESRVEGQVQNSWFGNGHLDITDLP
jgi:hypothetical protein